MFIDRYKGRLCRAHFVRFHWHKSLCVCVCVHKCIHRDDYLAEDKQGLSLSVGWSGDILFFVRVSLVLLVFLQWVFYHLKTQKYKKADKHIDFNPVLFKKYMNLLTRNLVYVHSTQVWSWLSQEKCKSMELFLCCTYTHISFSFPLRIAFEYVVFISKNLKC